MKLPEIFTAKQGITAIEVLLSVGITLLLLGSIAPLYGSLEASSKLETETDQIVQTLRLARERAVAGLGDSAHGVKFTDDGHGYILYQGASFALRDPLYDRETILKDILSLETTLPQNEINFRRGLGTPNVTGDVSLTHELHGVTVVQVNAEGLAERTN